MKFESSFLIRITQLSRSDWICLCPTVSLKAFAQTRQEAIEEMRAKLNEYVSTHGAYYIGSVGRSLDGVCCPEGLLELPFDIWKCKIDKQICKLQAWIPVNNKGQFIAGCHAPDQRKEDIYRIVTEGIYEGAHHKPGRYLCPTCKPDTRHHYSWELTSLSHFIDTNSHDFRVALIEKGISMSVITSSLCPECFLQVISIVKPALLDELENVQLNFTNEPFQASEPGDLSRANERASSDFIESLLASPDNGWRLGLALASLYGQDEYTPDFGDGLTLAGDWLGLTDEEVTTICNDEDESKSEKLHEIAYSVAWRAGWAVLCGGLEELLRRGWKTEAGMEDNEQ